MEGLHRHPPFPRQQQRGVKKLRVDGKDIATNILPVCPPRPEPFRVEAVLEG
jgi:hypothetical protein